MTTFIRVIENRVEHKERQLMRAIADLRRATSEVQGVFEHEPQLFTVVPGSPLAYWVNDHVRSLFARHSPFQARGERSAVFGGSTKDDKRYLRACWEVAADDVATLRSETLTKSWVLFAKGGQGSAHYADIHLVVGWRRDGLELKTDIQEYRGSRGWGYQWTAALNGHDHYFRPGLTWPRRTGVLSFRAMAAGCIFGDKGPAVFDSRDSPNRLLALSAILNCAPFAYLVGIQLARTELAQSYEVGLIQQTPVPNISEEETAVLAILARRAWLLRRSLDSTNENSHAFLLPSVLNERVTGLDPAAALQELDAIQRQIDDEAFRLYDVTRKDCAAIEVLSNRTDAGSLSESYEDDEIDESSAATAADASVSWLVGVTFSRFDPRLATGERPIPPEPEPFDPLPSRSPGMWPEGEEPADRPDILVSDEGHSADLVARVTKIAEEVGCDLRPDVRRWLACDFFPLHIRMYSKSRRKAPIYWQLATPSASYSVWLYIHAFTGDTLFRVQNDYVAPKLAHEERKLESMLRERDTATAQERKQLAQQQAFVDELRTFLDEVKRVAPLWNPDLDDGVILNFAPLWRLVPQHKPWQKELKAIWDALCRGEYDWSHLAMHLWPERVVPQCAADCSFAIAHGLEEVFWVEGSGGKWTARTTPARPVEELVRERSSPAVKAALTSLLEAPGTPGTGRKTKKGKANA